MNLDELQRVWAAHGESLERSLVINERLLRESLSSRVSSALTRFQLLRVLEVALGIATIASTTSVLADHLTERRYWFVAGGLSVVAAYVTGLCAYALFQSARVDFASPVASLQLAIERIRLAEFRAIRGTLLAGVVAWLPLALILFEALTGIAALARVESTWLVANLLFGLACLGVGHALSRRYLEGAKLAPWARRLVDSLSGHAVRSAEQQLAELARFSRNDELANLRKR